MNIHKPYLSIIFILLGIIAFMTMCQKYCKKCPESTTSTKIEYKKGDSIPFEVIVEKPYPQYRDTGTYQLYRQPVDTQLILQDYYTKNYYIDTIKDDTSALVVMKDIVSMNQLGKRALIFQNRRNTAIITNTTTISPEAKFVCYLGGRISGNKDSIHSFGIEFTACFKNGWMWSIGNNMLAKQPNGSLLIARKISFKK